MWPESIYIRQSFEPVLAEAAAEIVMHAPVTVKRYDCLGIIQDAWVVLLSVLICYPLLHIDFSIAA